MKTGGEKYAHIQSMIADAQYAQATAALEELVGVDTDHVAAHYDLGNLYYTAGMKQKALLHYEKTVALEPDNPLYIKNLADLLYAETDNIDRVLELYERILSLNPEDLQTLMVKGHICVSQKRFAEAKQCYQNILDIEPWNDEARVFLEKLDANANASVTDLSAAERYKQCQDQIRSGQIEAAMTGLKALISQFPDFAPAHNDLGVLSYQQGDKDRCRQHYEKALEIDPGNVNYNKNIADFYLVELGDVKKSLEIYASVLNNDPEDVESLMVAGYICESIHKVDSARLFYERVQHIEPWNFEASDRLERLNRR